MSNSFTKLFSDLVTSSVWSEDDKTRIMWITALASSDATGFVSGSIPGMAAIARMSIEDAERSIRALCSPDPYSRSKAYEGRRLIEADGGWLIVNYGKYRAKRDPEKRRLQNREAKRRQREREKNQSQQDVSQCQPMSAQAEAEADNTNTKRHSISVRFDYDNRTLTGLTDQDYEQWRDAFPAVDVGQEIKSACQWLIDNPAKRKRQVRRFLTNWLRRCQERGGNRRKINEHGGKNIRDNKEPYIR